METIMRISIALGVVANWVTLPFSPDSLSSFLYAAAALAGWVLLLWLACFLILLRLNPQSAVTAAKRFWVV